MREVEILKIGSIIPSFVGKKEQKKTIMIVRNGGPIFDYYVNKLKSCDEYNYLKSDQSIVGYSNPFIHFKANKKLNINSYKGAEFYYKNAVSLPIFYDLKVSSQKTIIKKIKI